MLVAPSITWRLATRWLPLVRRGHASHADIARAWKSFGQIPLRVAACDVAASCGSPSIKLYAYDAYVIETARAARTALMTLDDRQRAAAVACGVGILEVN